jgi:hypothetical protein
MPEESATLEQPQSTAPEPSSDLGEGMHEASAESNQPPQPKNGQEQQQPKKGLSRYERTKRERAAFKAEREAFQRERAAFAAERAQAAEPAKPKRDYTLKDLTDARTAWESEGRFDLVEAADKEIKAIKAEQEAQQAASNRTVKMPLRGTPEHTAMWNAAEADLAKSDPEFMREGTRLDTKLREIMAGPHGELYRDHAQGIYAAYDAAKRALLEEDKQSLLTELSKIKDELKRYRGLTSIGGGAPSRVGTGGRVANPEDFRRLTTKDQGAYLRQLAKGQPAPFF